MKRRVLFLCVDNCSGSQMAEALARIWAQGAVEAHSAGLQPGAAINPDAIAVMRELGYDLRDHAPKGLGALGETRFDVAVALGCEPPASLRAGRIERWEIADFGGAGEDVLRAVRDLLAERIRRLLGPAVTITRDRRSVKAALLASQASPMPLNVAAALAYRQLHGAIQTDIRPVLNDTALALAHVMDVHYVTPAGRLRRLPTADLTRGTFEAGRNLFRAHDGTLYQSLSVRRGELLNAIAALRRSKVPLPEPLVVGITTE
jgi:arsenate reductase